MYLGDGVVLTRTKSKGESSGALGQIKTDSEPQNGGTPGGSPPENISILWANLQITPLTYF